MITPTQFVNDETKSGKKFIKKVENLKSELGMKLKTEKTKCIKDLTPEQISGNSFLTDFMNNIKNSPDKELRQLYNNLELKNVTIQEFGRKAGYVNYPIRENYFRFIIHLGSPEIYYIDSDKVKNKQLPMMNGYGFMISPQEAPYIHFSVYSNTLRLIDDVKLHKIIPRIKPKDYKRTTLIYDFAFNFTVEDDIEDQKDDIEEIVIDNDIIEEIVIDNDIIEEIVIDNDIIEEIVIDKDDLEDQKDDIEVIDNDIIEDQKDDIEEDSHDSSELLSGCGICNGFLCKYDCWTCGKECGDCGRTMCHECTGEMCGYCSDPEGMKVYFCKEHEEAKCSVCEEIICDYCSHSLEHCSSCDVHFHSSCFKNHYCPEKE